MRGQIEVFEEHLYTETLQRVLRNALASLPQRAEPPRVLLTTFPAELHGLGLLMAEGMLALEGAACTSLGTQTPIRDIARAAPRKAPTWSRSLQPRLPGDPGDRGLPAARAARSRDGDLAGGANPGLVRRAVEGVHAIPELAAVPTAVARWRASRGGA
jgi:hypothetical protein